MSVNVPRILITGKDGQVGWESQRSLAALGDVQAVNRNEMDLSDASSIREIIQQIKPDIIVNTAAYTAVDKAEDDEDLALQINGIAPGVIAEEAHKIGALLVHYSTDYVFDGRKSTPYTEADKTNPLNVYGNTKLLGERNIQSTDVDNIIIRTSWVYASRGKNFLASILKLASEREELNIVADQIGSPTTARYIADVTAHMVKQSLSERQNTIFESNIYNLVSLSNTSWHGFSEEIIRLAKKHLINTHFRVKHINAITTEQYPVPAKRPKNSCLSTDKLTQHYGLALSDWKALLNLSIQDLK